MSLETLFGIASKTKQFKIYMDGILLKNEDILNFEMKFDMFLGFVGAVLSFRDSYSLANSKSVKINEETLIRAYIMDRYGKIFDYNFKPIDIKFDDTKNRCRIINFQLVDETAITLSKNTDSKSYTGKITDSFKQALSTYNVKKSTFTFDEKHECEDEDLISPSNTNEFDFFMNRLHLQGITYWMSHFKYNLKEIDISKFIDITSKATYNTEITNEANIFKIYQFKKINASKASIPVPTLQYTYTLGKERKTDIVSVKDLVSKVELNGNSSEFISKDSGNIVEITNANGLKSEQFNQLQQMLKNNQIVIFVSGSFEYGDVGNIINTKIGSKSPYQEQQLVGDPTASGKYVITSVIDKFLGTKFAQKITLSRFDNPKTFKI